MQLRHKVAYLLAAAVMLIPAAHASPAEGEEARIVSSAASAGAAAPETGVEHDSLRQPRHCVEPQRGCVPRPDAAAPAPVFQPGEMPPALRLALLPAAPVLPARLAPPAAQPFSILFRNFRS